jgi:hypothetical protein
MKTKLLMLFMFLVSLNVYSQSGIIHFTDGTTKPFTAIVRTHEEAVKNAQELSNQDKGLYVFYQNTYRLVPYTSLMSFKIIPEQIYNNFVSGTADVTTKTGITLNTPITIIDIDVTCYDELTGEVASLNFRFGQGNRLLISWVEFTNK